MPIANWGMANTPQRGFQNALAMGMQMGAQARQAREQREYRNALAQFDPANPDSLKPIMEIRPEVGIQLRGQMQAQQAQQVEAQQAAAKERRADLPMVVKLLETATDEASYQRNKQIAAQYGIDTSNLPENFDPAWKEQNLATMKVLSSPQGQEVMSTAGKQAVDEGLRPGTPEFQARVTELVNAGLVKTLSYQPGGNVVAYDTRTGTTTPLVRGESIEAATDYNPDEWEIVEGDAGGNASGGF